LYKESTIHSTADKTACSILLGLVSYLQYHVLYLLRSLVSLVVTKDYLLKPELLILLKYLDTSLHQTVFL